MEAGYIGLGNLGTAIARRLVAEGVTLTPWNRTEEKAMTLGLTPAESPAAVVSEKEIVFLVLSDSDAVAAVITGDDGLLQGECKGRIIVDMTTNHPERVVDFHRLFREREAAYLECPILGNVPMALEGKLTALVGTDRAALDRSAAYLEKFCTGLFYFDREGAATKMTLVNNLVLASLMAAIAEALGYSDAIGLSRARALDILGAGAAASALLQARKEKLIHEDFSPYFSSALMYKDLRYMQDLAVGMGRQLLTGEALARLYGSAIEQGLGDADIAAVSTLFRRPS